MRRAWIVGTALLITGSAALVRAHDAKDLPPGPIHDRHELMEKIGKNAKIIGDALKAGQMGPESGVGPAAMEISTSAAKIPALFPKGSTDPKSRAKAEIWTNWPKFEAGSKALEARAAEVANAAASGGSVAATAQEMFTTCKSCHEDFRAPEKDKK
jgi:cytochrome c556